MVAKKIRYKQIWVPKLSVSTPNPEYVTNHTLAPPSYCSESASSSGPPQYCSAPPHPNPPSMTTTPAPQSTITASPPPPNCNVASTTTTCLPVTEDPPLPSMENNIAEDHTHGWSMYSDIEAATDDFIIGSPNAEYQFYRAGGVHRSVWIVANIGFMLFLGRMAKLNYTPKIGCVSDLNHPRIDTCCFPLNPMHILSQVIHAAAVYMATCIPVIGTTAMPAGHGISSGIFIDADVWRPVALALNFLSEYSVPGPLGIEGDATG